MHVTHLADQDIASRDVLVLDAPLRVRHRPVSLSLPHLSADLSNGTARRTPDVS